MGKQSWRCSTGTKTDNITCSTEVWALGLFLFICLFCALLLLFLIYKKNVKDCVLPRPINLLTARGKWKLHCFSTILFKGTQTNSPCYQVFPTECHLQLCITSQIIATVKFPYSKVTTPADKCILLCLTWIWLSFLGGKMITLHTHTHSLTNFPNQKGNSTTFQKLKYLTSLR